MHKLIRYQIFTISMYTKLCVIWPPYTEIELSFLILRQGAWNLGPAEKPQWTNDGELRKFESISLFLLELLYNFAHSVFAASHTDLKIPMVSITNGSHYIIRLSICWGFYVSPVTVYLIVNIFIHAYEESHICIRCYRLQQTK